MNGEAWRVVFTRPAEHDLKRLPVDLLIRLIGPIGALAFVRRPSGSEKVVGSSSWRIRVGDVRIVYEVDPVARKVVVIRVALRSESTYRRLPR